MIKLDYVKDDMEASVIRSVYVCLNSYVAFAARLEVRDSIEFTKELFILYSILDSINK